MTAVLEAVGIRARLGGTEILHGVSLALVPGEVVALVGPNGSGKSTLMRTLIGLIAPSEGRVLLSGAPLANMPLRERARSIGYLAQETTLAWDLTVEEVLTLGATGPGAVFNFGAKADPAIVAALEPLYHRLDLNPLRGRRIKSLSGGERGRVLLGRVLAGKPAVLLADEPAAHLDVAHQASIMRDVRAEASSRGLSALVVLHDLNLAARFADRLVLMDGGRAVLNGPAAEVVASPMLDQVFGQAFARIDLQGRIAVLPVD